MDRILLCVPVLFFIWLTYRVIHWRFRIHQFRKILPVKAAFVHPWFPVRALIPRRWQSYCPDWQIFRRLDADIMFLVCLFGVDVMYIADPDAAMEVLHNTKQFPKDVKPYSSSSCTMSTNGRATRYLWTQRPYNGGSGMEGS